MIPRSCMILDGLVIRGSHIKKAEQVLIDNGIDPDEADTVLQAVGYVLIGNELYQE